MDQSAVFRHCRLSGNRRPLGLRQGISTLIQRRPIRRSYVMKRVEFSVDADALFRDGDFKLSRSFDRDAGPLSRKPSVRLPLSADHRTGRTISIVLPRTSSSEAASEFRKTMKRLIVITAAALIAARRLRLSRKQSNWAWSKINQVCMRMRPERSQILPPRWQWKSQVLGEERKTLSP